MQRAIGTLPGDWAPYRLRLATTLKQGRCYVEPGKVLGDGIRRSGSHGSIEPPRYAAAFARQGRLDLAGQHLGTATVVQDPRPAKLALIIGDSHDVLLAALERPAFKVIY